MSDRPGWRVERGAWVLGSDAFVFARVWPDGRIELDDNELRLDRAEAGVLARLLDAYAETGTVPMDGAVPQSDAFEDARAKAGRAAKWLRGKGYAITFRCDSGWMDKGWWVGYPSGSVAACSITHPELVEIAKNAGWTE